jgi:hypothetical protein
MGDVRTSLRALAHPGAVLALVVLVVNDHVLKEAWPGFVTGKLSDVAGLVVAPLLLGVLLTLLRAPHAAALALAATGIGFAFCKTSAVGAAVTSDVWSLFGTPTMIRADVTDLFALPALYGAWQIHRRAARSEGVGWRRTVSVAVGTAVLPLGVLATSATSCDEWRGFTEVAVVAGDFPGVPHEEETRLAAYDGSGWVTIDGRGRFDSPAVSVSGERDYAGDQQRVCVEDRCWRIVGGDAVDYSSDGGRSWDREVALTGADRDAIIEEEGDEECGNPLPVRATDLAAVDMDGVVQVVASLERGGVWRRNHDGTWTILTIDTLGELVDRDRPPPPVVTELDAPRSPEVPDPSVPAETPTPGCPSPTQRTVTPNPLNGPPTTNDGCP